MKSVLLVSRVVGPHKFGRETLLPNILSLHLVKVPDLAFNLIFWHCLWDCFFFLAFKHIAHFHWRNPVHS